MTSFSEPPELKEVLDFLQTIYRYRLDVRLIPSSLKDPFDKAVSRFQNPEELQRTNRSVIGIGEEVGDDGRKWRLAGFGNPSWILTQQGLLGGSRA
jgi:hypothetical protein